MNGEGPAMDADAPGTLWTVKTSSFRGISVGAEHYYVALSDGADEVRVLRRLDGPGAARLAEKDDYKWRAGSKVERFDTERDALKAAVTAWRTLAADGDVLVKHTAYMTDDFSEPVAGVYAAQERRIRTHYGHGAPPSPYPDEVVVDG